VLEARLVQGELEMKARPRVGRERLRTLAGDARKRGFLAIARRATAAAG
jgi:hypothetical protein